MNQEGEASSELSRLYKLIHIRPILKSLQVLSGGFEDRTNGGSEQAITESGIPYREIE
jgi:hypothetical protein